jgi:hypothetical protein
MKNRFGFGHSRSLQEKHAAEAVHLGGPMPPFGSLDDFFRFCQRFESLRS